MSEVSSFDLSRRIVSSLPQVEDMKIATQAFMLSSRDPSETSAEISESSDPQKLSLLVETLRKVVPVKDESVGNSSIVMATAFLGAAVAHGEEGSIPIDVAARQLLSLASIPQDQSDLQNALLSGNGFSDSVRKQLVDRIYHSSDISEESVRAISGNVPIFPVPTPDDEAFTSRVLSSVPESLVDEPLAYRAAMAARLLQVETDTPDADRMFSALTRVSSDYLNSEAVPQYGDLVVRLASDVAVQASASRLLESDPDQVSDSSMQIRSAMLLDSSLRTDIENVSRGQFHALPRGMAMDIRSDIETGGNLDSDLVERCRLVSAEHEAFMAERMSKAESILPVMPSPLESRDLSRPQPRETESISF